MSRYFKGDVFKEFTGSVDLVTSPLINTSAEPMESSSSSLSSRRQNKKATRSMGLNFFLVNVEIFLHNQILVRLVAYNFPPPSSRHRSLRVCSAFAVKNSGTPLRDSNWSHLSFRATFRYGQTKPRRGATSLSPGRQRGQDPSLLCWMCDSMVTQEIIFLYVSRLSVVYSLKGNDISVL